MTTMDLLHYAAQINKEGASCLAAGNSLAAFGYFMNSLEVLLVGIPQGRYILTSSPGLVSAASAVLTQPISYIHLLEEIPFCPGPTTTPKTLEPHIFCKAFVFQPNDDCGRYLTVRIRTYIAILCFNLATTVHQKGIGRSNCERELKAALELYDVAFDLLIQKEIREDDWANNINLAALNNMAQIHYELSEFTKAIRVLDLQKDLLRIIFDNKRPHNFSESEMELFILNTHLLRTPSSASAA